MSHDQNGFRFFSFLFMPGILAFDSVTHCVFQSIRPMHAPLCVRVRASFGRTQTNNQKLEILQTDPIRCIFRKVMRTTLVMIKAIPIVTCKKKKHWQQKLFRTRGTPQLRSTCSNFNKYFVNFSHPYVS